MTSRAPGGWSPYGGPVPDEPRSAPPTEPRRPPWVLASLALLEFFIIVGLAGWLYWKYQHDKDHPSGTPAPGAGVKSLSHVAVERYIGDQFDLDGVVCNDGANFPMTSDGATFGCTSAAGKTFTVTVTDKQTGDYSVRANPSVHPSSSRSPH